MDNIKIISCNKNEPKSDWYCKNLYPEGILSNGWKFRDVGEVTELYNEKGWIQALYHNSELKKDVKRQYKERQ